MSHSGVPASPLQAPGRELVLGEDANDAANIPVMEVAARRAAPTSVVSLPAPQALPRQAPRPVVSPEEARASVDLPDPPQSALGAIGYASRARRRKAELAEQLREARQTEEEAQVSLEDSLVAIAERARPAAQAMAAYRRTLERLVALEQRMRALDPQHASQLDGLRAQIVPLDERISAMERELAALKAEEARINDQLTQAEASIFRAKAKLSVRDLGGTDPRMKK